MSRQPEGPVFDASDRRSPSSVPASQTCLLLLDYHNLVVNFVGSAALTSVSAAASMRDWALARGALVVHGLVDVDLPVVATSKSAPRFKTLFNAMSAQPGALDEHDGIKPKDPAEVVLTRPLGKASSLKSPGIDALFAERKIRSLIVCGIATSGTVLSSTLQGTDDGFVVSVIEDACCDPVDNVHRTLLASVLENRAHVCSAEEFQARF